MTAPAPPQYVGIQYTRAAAALGVVAFHACQRLGIDFSAGARGVDVFFVISGFIMWGITADRMANPLAFISNRLIRIVPLYWIATGVVIAASVSGLIPDGGNDLSPGSIAKSLFFVPYFPEGSTYAWPILTPGWTLNFEMFFYAVFAAFLLAPVRWRLWGLSLTFSALVLVGAAGVGSGAVWETYTSPLILLFLAGIWLAEVLRRRSVLLPFLAVLSIILGTAALLFVPVEASYLHFAATSVAALLVVGGVASLDFRGIVPSFKVPRLLGDASYSIYLWHGVALSIAMKISGQIGLSASSTILLGIAGGTIGGVISFWIIEQPLLKALRPKQRKLIAAQQG